MYMISVKFVPILGVILPNLHHTIKLANVFLERDDLSHFRYVCSFQMKPRLDDPKRISLFFLTIKQNSLNSKMNSYDDRKNIYICIYIIFIQSYVQYCFLFRLKFILNY